MTPTARKLHKLRKNSRVLLQQLESNSSEIFDHLENLKGTYQRNLSPVELEESRSHETKCCLCKMRDEALSGYVKENPMQYKAPVLPAQREASPSFLKRKYDTWRTRNYSGQVSSLLHSPCSTRLPSNVSFPPEGFSDKENSYESPLKRKKVPSSTSKVGSPFHTSTKTNLNSSETSSDSSLETEVKEVVRQNSPADGVGARSKGGLKKYPSLKSATKVKVPLRSPSYYSKCSKRSTPLRKTNKKPTQAAAVARLSTRNKNVPHDSQLGEKPFRRCDIPDQSPRNAPRKSPCSRVVGYSQGRSSKPMPEAIRPPLEKKETQPCEHSQLSPRNIQKVDHHLRSSNEVESRISSYDIIAGLCENEHKGKLVDCSDWFEDLKNFRQANWFDCHAHASPGEARRNRVDNSHLSKIGCYQLNERLMPELVATAEPTHIPTSPLRPGDSHILLSVPSATLENLYEQSKNKQDNSFPEKKQRKLTLRVSDRQPDRESEDPRKLFSGRFIIDRLRKNLVPENSFALRFQPTK